MVRLCEPSAIYPLEKVSVPVTVVPAPKVTVPLVLIVSCPNSPATGNSLPVVTFPEYIRVNPVGNVGAVPSVPPLQLMVADYNQK